MFFTYLDFPDPGEQELYNGIKEINRNNYPGALYHFEKASNHQDEYGMLFNAILHFTGLGLSTRNPRKAMNIFKSIAHIYNNSVAMFFIGLMYLGGDKGVPAREKAGIHWLNLSANEGWKYAMGVLGKVYLFNTPANSDHKKAMEWFKKVAIVDNSDTYPIKDGPYHLFGNKKFKLDFNGVHPAEVEGIQEANNGDIISLISLYDQYDATISFSLKKLFNLTLWDSLTNRKSIIVSTCQYYISLIYFLGLNRIQTDIRRSVYWTRKAVKNGNSEASMQLGTFYELGFGVEKDDKEALKYYKKSNDVEACFKVGTFYFEGKGTDRDHKVALLIFDLVASNVNHGPSYFLMGKIYKEGKDGVQQNYERSIDCFSMAFVFGVPEAATELGISYRNGHGVQKDNQKAIEWFKKGALLGCPKSLYALGLIHFNGDNGAANYGAAFLYFMLSSKRGFEPAYHMLRQVSEFVDLE